MNTSITYTATAAATTATNRVSGQNMLVPVGVHFLYDFSALFLTWLAASRDANDRVRRAEQIMRVNSGAAMCKCVDG